MHYCPKSGAFFDEAMPGMVVPDGAVAITRARHAQLMTAQAAGRRIVADTTGRPIIAPEAAPTVAALRDAAISAIRSAARWRILAIASLERQSNDNALLAAGGAPTDVADARKRRAAIDAVRAASNDAQAMIASLGKNDLTGADFAALARWPKE